MSVKPDIIQPGQPLWSTYTADWANRIHDILWGLSVEGGRIIRLEDKNWKIVVEGGPGGGRWTGVLWFGNERIVVGTPQTLAVWDEETSNPVQYAGVVTGEYLVVNLRGAGDPIWRFENGADPMTEEDRGTVPSDEDVDYAVEQVFHVADYVEELVVDSVVIRQAGYKLNRNTQGDIHARIT
jgi:hypothetical protein